MSWVWWTFIRLQAGFQWNPAWFPDGWLGVQASRVPTSPTLQSALGPGIPGLLGSMALRQPHKPGPLMRPGNPSCSLGMAPSSTAGNLEVLRALSQAGILRVSRLPAPWQTTWMFWKAQIDMRRSGSLPCSQLPAGVIRQETWQS